MKITDVRVQRYAWPRPKPIRNGKYTYVTVGLNLVHIETDAGFTGIGWGGGTAAGRPGEVTAALLEHFKLALIGEDPFNYRRLWDAMWEPKIVGRRGISTQVISAIDIALWDVMGKAVNKSIHKLLGGYHDPSRPISRGATMKRAKGWTNWRRKCWIISRWEPKRSR